MTGDALRTMIENIDLKRHRKRRFFRGIAAASLAATTAVGTACVGENETASAGGMAPDMPDMVMDDADRGGDQGVGGDEFAPADVLEQELGAVDTAGETADHPDVDVIEGHDGFAPGGIMPEDTTPADVIDSETAMDGGMWADDAGRK